MKKIKEVLNLKEKPPGILEYLFGGLAVMCALPPIITYLFIVVFIVKPVNELVKSVWK